MKCRRNNFKRRRDKYSNLENNLLLTSGKPIISKKRRRKDYNIRKEYYYLQEYSIFFTSAKKVLFLVLPLSIVCTILFSILDINNTHVGDPTIIGVLEEFLLFNVGSLATWFMLDFLQALMRASISSEEEKGRRWETRIILCGIIIRILMEIYKKFYLN